MPVKILYKANSKCADNEITKKNGWKIFSPCDSKTGWMFEKHGKPNLRTQMVYIEMYECVDVEVL